MNLKNLFCAKCQDSTAHEAVVDANGEFVFTCTAEECGRFIKFPADTTPEQFGQLLTKHEVLNEGQVSLEEQETVLTELLDIEPEPLSEETEEPAEDEEEA